MPDVSSVAVPQKPAATQPTFQVAARYAPEAVGNVVVDAAAAVSSVNVLGLAVVVFPELFVARTLSVYWPSRGSSRRGSCSSHEPVSVACTNTSDPLANALSAPVPVVPGPLPDRQLD